jgi:succinyl-CoA synthetase beta subunit
MSHTLSEADSMALLVRHGIPSAPGQVVLTAAAAGAAAEAIGFPVVAKLCGDSIAHKTERGLVRLGLTDADAVRIAAGELLTSATEADGEVGLLVAPMIRGSRELIAGLNRDPQFGMTVMVGVGGVLAEAVADVSIRLVPIDRADAAQMLDDLSTQAVLGAFRGEPELDRSAMIDLLMGLSEAAGAHPELMAADLNPVIISDGHPIAVDALVEIESS